MQYSYGLGSEELNTFTMCLRFNVEFLRPELTEILSYSTFISDNSLEAYLIEVNKELSIGFSKYWGLDGITKICSIYPVESVQIHNQWHHVCWLVNTEGIDSDEIKVTTKIFFDGREANKGDALLLNPCYLYSAYRNIIFICTESDQITAV